MPKHVVTEHVIQTKSLQSNGGSVSVIRTVSEREMLSHIGNDEKLIQRVTLGA